MTYSDDSLPIAVVCPHCLRDFRADIRKFEKAGYTVCPFCGGHVPLTANPIPGPDIPDFGG
jgi:hypothetical protein